MSIIALDGESENIRAPGQIQLILALPISARPLCLKEMSDRTFQSVVGQRGVGLDLLHLLGALKRGGSRYYFLRIVKKSTAATRVLAMAPESEMGVVWVWSGFTSATLIGVKVGISAVDDSSTVTSSVSVVVGGSVSVTVSLTVSLDVTILPAVLVFSASTSAEGVRTAAPEALFTVIDLSMTASPS